MATLASTTDSSVTCERRDGVARVTLNRPPLNILDIAMIAERILAQVQSRDDVKVLRRNSPPR